MRQTMHMQNEDRQLSTGRTDETTRIRQQTAADDAVADADDDDDDDE